MSVRPTKGTPQAEAVAIRRDIEQISMLAEKHAMVRTRDRSHATLYATMAPMVPLVLKFRQWPRERNHFLNPKKIKVGRRPGNDCHAVVKAFFKGYPMERDRICVYGRALAKSIDAGDRTARDFLSTCPRSCQFFGVTQIGDA
jgi:hypothetical protein